MGRDRVKALRTRAFPVSCPAITGPRSAGLNQVVVHHRVRVFTSDVEIELATGLLPLSERRRIEPVGERDTDDSVGLPVRPACVHVGDDRCDAAPDRFVSRTRFPETPLD